MGASLLRFLSIPEMEASRTEGQCRYDVAGFVSRWRAQFPWVIADADGVWRLLIDDYSEYATAADDIPTRNQVFRQLGAAGVRKFRSGSKDDRGKRPYLYRLAPRGRPRRRPGRSAITVLDGVAA